MKTTSTDELAKILWNYNNLKQELVISDAILVLGSNDIRIARYGAELFFQKYAPIIIFSGGFGALTKYLFDKPEAEIFAAEAIKLGVPEDRIFIENQSTNTGDNIIKSKKLIRDNNMAISSFIVVQKPYMLRQAYATFMK